MKINNYNSYALAFIFVLSLWLRVAYFETIVVDVPVRGDAVYYIQYAKNLLTHYTFSKDAGNTIPIPDSYWSPGYPVFLAISISIADVLDIDPYQVIMYLQALLGAMTAVITFLVARLFMGPKWSLVPAVFVALSPHLVSLGGYLLTETLFGFVLLVAIYLFLLAFEHKSRLHYSASGIFFGLAYLVNPVMFFMPILFIIAAVYLYVRRLKVQLMPVRSGLILCMVLFFAIVSTWQIRGLVNVPSDAPSSSGRLFTNLVIGSHSNFFEVWRANPRDENNPATRDEEMLGGSYSAFAALLFHRIIQEPWHYAQWYLINKPVLLWSWNIQVGQGDIYVYPVLQSLYQKSRPALVTYSIMKSLHYWLFGFAILGLFFVFNHRFQVNTVLPVFLYIALVYISSIYVITQSEPRYSVPMRPEFYLCAVYFLYKVVEYLNQRKLDRLRSE